MFAKINISGQFADDVDVNVARAICGQRGQAAERGAQINRAKVDVQTKFLAQRKQAAFRPLANGPSIPFRAANRSQ